jgi:chromatin segregation and condensation protein Rec8/ScpA/Scc1 (kleisin family)
MKSEALMQKEDEVNELRYQCQSRDYELNRMWERLQELEEELQDMHRQDKSDEAT